MKKFTISLIALFSAVLTLSSATAQQEPGKELTAVPAMAEGLSLHNLFQSNMVLQREKPITIWGWAVAGEEVSVSFGGKTQTAKAGADRSWKVIFPAMPATGEPLQMTIKGKTATLTFDNILMGDVWVMGGQSNMQEPIRNLENGHMEIASANFPKIRLLTVPTLVDNQEKKNFPRRQKDKQPDGEWDICSPQTVPDFSGIGYIFARRIHMASQIPIGVIDASHWGTRVESWTPLSVVKSIDSDAVRALLADWDRQVAAWDPKKALENQIKQYEQRMAELKKQGKPSNEPPPSKPSGAPIDNQYYPGNCYASMISPIAGFAVKGAVWHQGYCNARPDAETFYYQVFPKMIASWRAAFNDAAMPFGIISLCTDTAPQTLDNYLECMMDFGIYVREAHYKTFLDFYKAGDKNIGYASSYDHRAAWWHPELKIPTAERIARWAMVTQYGFSSVNWKPPMVTKVEPKDNTLILNFDSDMASVNNEAMAGFSIAGKDGKFQPAKAEYLVIGKDNNGQPQITWKALVLSHPLVPNPIHYRFAWGRNPMGNLRMTYIKDVPLAAQRSDTWTVADMYENYTGKKSAVPGLVNGGEVEELKKALKAADLERRIFEAQALLDSQKKAEPGASSQLAENLRKGKSQHLVVYGTSLCTPEYSAWVSQVQALIEAGFPKLCTVTNSAQAGAASNWGLDNIDARVIAQKPDTVLIEFSINDAYSLYKISVADAQKNLETMIEKVHKALPKCEIILMTMNQPFPVGAEPRPAFLEYGAMYRKVAKERNLKLIDVQLVWEKLFTDDQKKWHLVVPDNVHPTKEGNELVTTPTIVRALFGSEKVR